MMSNPTIHHDESGCGTVSRPMLERAWGRVLDESGVRARLGMAGAAPSADPSAIQWIMDELLVLLAGLGDLPVESVRPRVRELLADKQFVNDNGDIVVGDDQIAALIEQEIDLVLAALDLARQDAGWMEGTGVPGPAAVPMFG